MTAIVSVVGRKGSGKSGVLETLIALLSAKGFRVGVVKRLAREDVEIDEPGTDTHRYRSQGARKVILAGRKRLAMFWNFEEEIPLEELLVLFRDFDLVFLEGYVQGDFPKIEVHKKELGDFLLTERVEHVIAVCSDGEGRTDVPFFTFNELDKLVTLIEDQLLKKEAGVF